MELHWRLLPCWTQPQDHSKQLDAHRLETCTALIVAIHAAPQDEQQLRRL